MIFVVGGYGFGKAALVESLMRNYSPSVGTITRNDEYMHFLAPRFVKHRIAGVSRSCVLFDASVLENVAMGAINGESLPRSTIEDACRSALMHEFVRDLPNGYDTALGTSGASLSGGQKQRLAIARAKIRDPTVLILGKPFLHISVQVTDFVIRRSHLSSRSYLAYPRLRGHQAIPPKQDHHCYHA